MRHASLLAVAVIVSAFFAACGSDSSDGSSTVAGGAGGEPSLPSAGEGPGQAGSSIAGAQAQGGSGQGDAGSGSSGEAGAETGMAGAGNPDACPSERGSPMVRLPPDAGGFCIDARETTRAEYALFLADPNVAPQPAACAFNAVPGGYLPGNTSNSDDMDLPQGGVDWCDARAYCEWAGKRLCGKIGGGAVPLGMSNDASVSQWQSACSRGGTRVFPYGNEYQGLTCNGFESGNASLISALDQTCEGGYAGIFNMSGNAWEWEDACGMVNDEDTCQLRSGEYTNDEGFLRCDYLGFSIRRSFNVSGTVGIRCCGP